MNLFDRVQEEIKENLYNSHVEAALDHLNMSMANLFEEFEGVDILNIYSDLEKVLEKLNNFKN